MTDSTKMTKIAIEALEDKKAMNIRVLDIHEISPLADYFVIASGTNRNQVQAMADNVEEALGKAGFKSGKVEGYNSANWILLDFQDIVVHIFDEENRGFYNLERLWTDGKPVDPSEF